MTAARSKINILVFAIYITIIVKFICITIFLLGAEGVTVYTPSPPSCMHCLIFYRWHRIGTRCLQSLNVQEALDIHPKPRFTKYKCRHPVGIGYISDAYPLAVYTDAIKGIRYISGTINKRHRIYIRYYHNRHRIYIRYYLICM